MVPRTQAAQLKDRQGQFMRKHAALYPHKRTTTRILLYCVCTQIVYMCHALLDGSGATL